MRQGQRNIYKLLKRREAGEAARLGRSLGALLRGAATCYDAAPSGAHTSSTTEHARILAADDGCDLVDELVLAVKDFPAIATLGFGGLELCLVVRLDVLLAELLTPATVCGEGDDGKVEVEAISERVVFGVLCGLSTVCVAGVTSGSGGFYKGGAGGACDSNIEGGLLAGGVGIGEEAVDGFFAKVLEDGVLLLEGEALRLEELCEGAVGDGVVALEGAAGRAGEEVRAREEAGIGGAASRELGAGGDARGIIEDAEGG